MSNGWNESAQAWIDWADRDPNRALLLDPIMLGRLGDVSGRDILDVGCGEGRFCRMLRERGAQAVGIDPTCALLRQAAKRDSGFCVRALGEQLPFRNGSFDEVVSYLSLIDIEGFRLAIFEIARVLRPGGRVFIANLNPFVTSLPNPWYRDQCGNRIHVAVKDYNIEVGQAVGWAGIEIVNFHRPMSSYLGALLDAGLILRFFTEPVPGKEAIKADPALDDLNVPLFHVMEWQKPKR